MYAQNLFETSKIPANGQLIDTINNHFFIHVNTRTIQKVADVFK